MSIREHTDEVIREFAGLDDWMERYEYLIELGGSLEHMDPALRLDENAVSGCQSQVWVSAEIENGVMKFHADSDALITRGLIGLLMRVLDGASPESVMNADLGFLDTIGIRSDLSPSRANGLASITGRMKQLAERAADGHPPGGSPETA